MKYLQGARVRCSCGSEAEAVEWGEVSKTNIIKRKYGLVGFHCRECGKLVKIKKENGALKIIKN